MMLSILLAGLLTCAGVDDTAAIQAAVDAGDVELSGSCVVNGVTGVRVPGERRVTGDGTAVVSLLPGCRPRCKAFETVVGAAGIRFADLELAGDPTPLTGLEWRNGIRIDSATDVEIRDVRFHDWRTDGVWIGGNVPSRWIALSRLKIERSGRNGISVTNAEDVRVIGCYIADAPIGADPGAGIDSEPNPGERVDRLTIIGNEFYGNVVGMFLHPGKGSPGSEYVIVNNVITASRKIAIALNSAKRGLIYGNTVTDAPIGVTVGSATEARRAYGVAVIDNEIVATRPLLLAGVKDSWILDNLLNGGHVETPALGTSGSLDVK